MHMFYMVLILWSCGEKKVQNAPISSNKNKNQTEGESISNQSEVSQQETYEKNATVQLKYFHKDFIEKGANPKYLSFDVAYVSEQQLLDDLYSFGKQQEHFYPCQSTGSLFLGLDDNKARVQLKGGCGGCGTFGIYDHISETLQQLPHISRVQILAPEHKGEAQSDRPSCLEP